MPGMPKAGPPRPVFKPPAAGGAAAAGRGRGRGASQPSSKRPAREASLVKKPARPMNASPFGAPSAPPDGSNQESPAQIEAPTTGSQADSNAIE